ncbi:MAG TPA: ABC transporter permease subunit [Casimicrobiaceae bacterium]|nr:ABC transporter permease subunit [Thermoanaerobaculia bacterium]HLX26914.1 ABC transporter permease subunit [Casimicrobiaceae bacterium]
MKIERVAAVSPLSRAGEVAILVGFLIVAWQLLHYLAGDIAMTTPLQTFRYTARLLVTQDFWVNAAASGQAFAGALAIGLVAGPVIGILFGFHRLSGEVAEPILVALYSIPKVILYPIILLVFGLGLAAEVAFGTLHGIVPVMLFTMNAVRNIKPVLVRTGRALGLSTFAMMRTILLPAALPEIFTGLRIGFSVTLLGTIMSEMFGSKRGLGFLLMQALGVNDVQMIMALTLMLVAFASIANAILMSFERQLYRRT